MRSRAPLVTSPAYQCDIGMHVFPVRKYAMIRDRLIDTGVVAASEIVEPPAATRDELLRVHTAEYLEDLRLLRWTPRTMWSELPLTAEIVTAYVTAAGGTLRAARAALAHGAAAHVGGGFHHAFADRAEGFCYVNDLAVAIRVLQHEGLVRRAAVVDLDVHHGNGTAAIFRDDPTVFTLSIHQQANYPAIKPPSDLDVGLDDRTGDDAYGRALEAALARVWAFEPEIVLYQAGADPYVEDMLGGLALSLAGLAARDRQVVEGCARRRVPLVVTLGGGYARRVEDTVAIHAETIRQAIEGPGRA